MFFQLMVQLVMPFYIIKSIQMDIFPPSDCHYLMNICVCVFSFVFLLFSPISRLFIIMV